MVSISQSTHVDHHHKSKTALMFAYRGKMSSRDGSDSSSSSSSSSSQSDDSYYDEAPANSGGTHLPTWNTSKHKALGARVYAKYLNDSWYWGIIVGASGGRFRVLFEDGDDLKGIESQHIMTEAEYIRSGGNGDEDKHPPHPKITRRVERKLKRLLGRFSPPDFGTSVWARIIDLMPLGDAVEMLLVSEPIAEAAEEVRVLNVTSSLSMSATTAELFPNVKEVHVFCLFDSNWNPPPRPTYGTFARCGAHVCDETAMLLVPFLSNFRKLERFELESVIEAEWVKKLMIRRLRNEPKHFYLVRRGSIQHGSSRDVFRSLRESIIGALKLPHHFASSLQSLGSVASWIGHCGPCIMHYPPRNPEDDSIITCRSCKQVCEHFPLEDVRSSALRESICLEEDVIENILRNRL